MFIRCTVILMSEYEIFRRQFLETRGQDKIYVAKCNHTICGINIISTAHIRIFIAL
jgi:hypothetical protein